MDESIAEFYYEQLKSTTNPVGTLVAMYKSLFNIEKVDTPVYASFAKLCRIYGRELIYFSLLDCADMDNINFETGIGRLISYFAKKRLENTVNFNVSVDLTSLVKEFEKNEGKKRKIKISIDPFEEVDNG